MERDPLVLAKEIATVDKLSGRRILFGIGTGWNAEEMENRGVAWNNRRAVTREKIEAMKAAWTQEESEYHGKFVNFEPSWCFPKPARSPYPPILMGGNGSIAIEYTAEHCDGWLPARS